MMDMDSKVFVVEEDELCVDDTMMCVVVEDTICVEDMTMMCMVDNFVVGNNNASSVQCELYGLAKWVILVLIDLVVVAVV